MTGVSKRVDYAAEPDDVRFRSQPATKSHSPSDGLSTRKPSKSPKTKIYLLCIAALILLVGGAVVVRTIIKQPSQPIFPETTAFTSYAFDTVILPGGLKIDEKSITYDGSILLYSLTDENDRSIGISQQSIPKDFSSSILQGDEDFSTPIGTATFSNTLDGRLTGTILTKDRTFIILNTQSTIETTVFKDIIRALRPISRP